MSRLWRERLRIALAPDKVVAVRSSGGRAAKVEQKAAWPCEPRPSDAHRWEPALRALAQGLDDMKARGADAAVVLSNHFVRYALLPWSDHVTGFEERQAMARIMLEKQYGGAADSWAIRLSDGGYGKAALASAVDAALTESILQTLAGAGLQPVSIQPYLMSAFNQFRPRLAGDSICMVVAEQGKVGILMGKGGEWHAVRTLPVRADLARELAPVVRREILLAGLPQPLGIYLHAPGLPQGSQLDPADLQAEVLDLPERAGWSPRADAAYAMAMSGAA